MTLRLAGSDSDSLLVLGLMSGTSMDGIDGVLARLQRRSSGMAWEVVDRRSLPYPDELYRRLDRAIRPGGADAAELTQLHAELGEHAANLVELVQQRGNRVELVAMSGQTVYHIPRLEPERGWRIRSTLQLGEPSRVVERCRVPVVSDLRQGDMAAGGGAAPMVPFGDLLLFAGDGLNRAIHNLGGISNVTWLPADGNPERVLAFDTGPANCLLDELAQSKAGVPCDEDGRLAGAGAIDETVLAKLMDHPYLRLPPPKTTGREVFNLAEFRGTGLEELSTEDALATATAYSAQSIATAYREHVLPRGLDEVLLAGGGARNPALVSAIRSRLEVPVSTFEERGWNSRDREGLAFAVMAYEAWHGRVNTLPSATGATRAVISGRISLPGPR